jgi:hypothetical protein
MIPVMSYYSKNSVVSTNLASLITESYIFNPHSLTGFSNIEKYYFELRVEKCS